MKKLILAIALSSLAFSGTTLAHTHNKDKSYQQHTHPSIEFSDFLVKNLSQFLTSDEAYQLYNKSLAFNFDHLSYSDAVHSSEVEKAKKELLKEIMPPASRARSDHYDIPESWKQHRYQHRVSEKREASNKSNHRHEGVDRQSGQNYRDSERFQEIMKERREHKRSIREKQMLIEEQELDIQILENEMRIKKLERMRKMSKNKHTKSFPAVN
jgi:hypothetical protein